MAGAGVWLKYFFLSIIVFNDEDKKDTFLGRNPNEVAVVYPMLIRPATI